MEVVWYKTAEEVFEAYFGFQGEAKDFEPLSDAEISTINAEIIALCESGEHHEISAHETIQAMKDQGVWGFAETDARVIHAWADPQADPADVLHMLAHEIGHLTGTPDEDDLREELRADSFGKVAAQAYRLLTSNSPHQEKCQTCKGEGVLKYKDLTSSHFGNGCRGKQSLARWDARLTHNS